MLLRSVMVLPETDANSLARDGQEGRWDLFNAVLQSGLPDLHEQVFSLVWNGWVRVFFPVILSKK